jgi:hypothetical protein
MLIAKIPHPVLLAGQGCFALFSKCGGVDVDNFLVSKFGDSDRPTRAPTEPVVQVCDEEKMT